MMKQKLLLNTNITAGVNTSSALLRYVDDYAVQINTSNFSTAVGLSVTLEGSNDDVNYDTIAGTMNAITANGTGSINVENAGYRHVRAALLITSGSADIEILITGKERRI